MGHNPPFLKKWFGHFYATSYGYNKICAEIKEMETFPFENIFHQNPNNGDAFYIIDVPCNGVMHCVKLTYAYDHPNYEMRARIISPFIDRTRTGHHLYANGDVCYIKNWERNFRAIHVAMQVCFWIKDYWNNNLDNIRNYDLDPNDITGFLRRFMH